MRVQTPHCVKNFLGVSVDMQNTDTAVTEDNPSPVRTTCHQWRQPITEWDSPLYYTEQVGHLIGNKAIAQQTVLGQCHPSPSWIHFSISPDIRTSISSQRTLLSIRIYIHLFTFAVIVNGQYKKGSRYIDVYFECSLEGYVRHNTAGYCVGIFVIQTWPQGIGHLARSCHNVRFSNTFLTVRYSGNEFSGITPLYTPFGPGGERLWYSSRYRTVYLTTRTFATLQDNSPVH